MPSRVPQLYARHGADMLDDRCYSGQTPDLAIVVDTGTVGAGAAVWQNRRLLGKHETKAACGPRPKQHDMGTVHEPVSERYIVIGDIAMRLRSVISLSVVN